MEFAETFSEHELKAKYVSLKANATWGKRLAKIKVSVGSLSEGCTAQWLIIKRLCRLSCVLSRCITFVCSQHLTFHCFHFSLRTQVDYKTAFRGTSQDKEALLLAMVKNSDIDVTTIVEYCRSVNRPTYISTTKFASLFPCLL